MSMDESRMPECPACGFLVWDFEPGVSSEVIDGELYHPDCVPHPAERQEWMRRANDLLLKEGISRSFPDAAEAAYEDGDTPEIFVKALLGQMEWASDPYPNREYPECEMN